MGVWNGCGWWDLLSASVGVAQLRQGCGRKGRMGWIVYRRIGLWLDKYQRNIVYNGRKLVIKLVNKKNILDGIK